MIVLNVLKVLKVIIESVQSVESMLQVWFYKSLNMQVYNSTTNQLTNHPTNNVKARDPVGSKKWAWSG